MTFAENIELWRSTVRSVVQGLRSVESSSLAVLKLLALSDRVFEDLVLAIIQRESSGESGVVGDQGCSFGLMQINYCAHQRNIEFLRYPWQDPGGSWSLRDVGSPDELLNAMINIGVGVRYLVSNLNEFHDVELAILAYNGHEATLRYIAEVDDVPSNLGYLQGVLAILRISSGWFDQLVEKKSSGVLFALVALVAGVLGVSWWKSHRG